jgi:metal-responsive CopG/Arc/MetJ family transcriptional regulator
MKDNNTEHHKRVSISLPSHLFDWGEATRAKQNIPSRSKFIALLYQRAYDEITYQDRIDRYKAAYAKTPVTPEEEILTNASMDLLAEDFSSETR